MVIKLGIGVTTFNRCEKLAVCISQLRRLTNVPFELVVADDGSEDGTTALCAREKVRYVTGKNMGIAWNKNRALFFLHRIVGCDVIILLEDDCYPNQLGWQDIWIAAAQKWGHANLAGHWFSSDSLIGDGTVDSPFVSALLSGQCAVFHREALKVCGFIDSRFKGYGYEHAEHSSRLVRAGFGGEMRMAERGEIDPHYYLLASDLSVSADHSYRDEESMALNWIAWSKMYRDPLYRPCWRTTDGLLQFWKEMRTASSRGNFSYRRRLSVDGWFVRQLLSRLRSRRR